MDPREGNNFMAAVKHMNWILDVRARDRALLTSLGLQWFQERETIFMVAAKPMDWILNLKARDRALLQIMQWIQDWETISWRRLLQLSRLALFD